MASIGANLTQSLKKIKNFLPILPIFNPDFSKMGMALDGQNGCPCSDAPQNCLTVIFNLDIKAMLCLPGLPDPDDND